MLWGKLIVVVSVVFAQDSISTSPEAETQRDPIQSSHSLSPKAEVRADMIREIFDALKPYDLEKPDVWNFRWPATIGVPYRPLLSSYLDEGLFDSGISDSGLPKPNPPKARSGKKQEAAKSIADIARNWIDGFNNRKSNRPCEFLDISLKEVRDISPDTRLSMAYIETVPSPQWTPARPGGSILAIYKREGNWEVRNLIRHLIATTKRAKEERTGLLYFYNLDRSASALVTFLVYSKQEYQKFIDKKPEGERQSLLGSEQQKSTQDSALSDEVKLKEWQDLIKAFQFQQVSITVPRKRPEPEVKEHKESAPESERKRKRPKLDVEKHKEFEPESKSQSKT